VKIARHIGEKLAPTAAFVGLGVVLFAAAMTGPLDYDEEHYVAGAYFARDLSVYRDFVSVQPPLYTWILSAVLDVVDDWYLLTARLVTWVFGFGACALLYSLLTSCGTGRVGAFALVVGFATSPFTEGPLVETRNDIMPLCFFLAALRLCLGADGEFSRSVPRLMLSGLFAALAMAMKYTYVFAAPILAAVLLYDEHVRREANSVFTAPRTGSFLAGAALGALPLVYSLAVHRDRFVFETLQFHLTAGFDWYQSQGFGEFVTLEHKIRSLPRQVMLRGNASILVIGAVSALAVALSSRFRRISRWEPRTIALVGLFCGALVFATLAGPGAHAMYFAPVVALGALLAGRVYAAARPGIPPWLTAMLLIISLLPAATAYQRYGARVVRSADLGQWTGVQTHRSAVRIAQMLAQHGVSGHVATLFPVVVMDANRVLPEFAAGPFFFRSADIYSAEQVAQLHGVGPATLETLFAVSPPAAIVGGFGPFRFKWNPSMDAALIDYARRSGFVRVADDWTLNGYRNGQVWIGPANQEAAPRTSNNGTPRGIQR
jgi:4-amino-4-deoxy-L-arabinose transferase-like glycosyltransferase